MCTDGSCFEELCRWVEFESASQDSDGCIPPPPSFSEISHCSGIILINDAENIVINMLYVGMSLCSIESGSFSNWCGLKIVSDNLDITICPRSQRVDCKASSLHFFHCFVVRDRVNFSLASESPKPLIYRPISDLPQHTLLPTLSDDQSLLSHFSVIISCVLAREIPYFAVTFHDVIQSHIRHKHCDKMSLKSETVSSMFCLVHNII